MTRLPLHPRHLALLLFSVFTSSSLPGQEAAGDAPRVHDERLELTLLADSEMVVTPIGLALDSHDRIHVIESHTHLPPRDYDGPRGDRILVFTDPGDGKRAPRPTIFAGGLEAAMNLAFLPDDTLLVVCAREVVALEDLDGDGSSDHRLKLLELETSERYPHNSLLGITTSADGWIHVARGNTGGKKYTVRTRTGETLEGYGDGGDVFRLRPDGSALERVATGFWNPFDLVLDHADRLVLVDNDPDARGPNRLVHVVPGGDYGYRSVYGGTGNHPFQGWDGSLPGTLPFISGTGEAPSGVIDTHRVSLPPGFAEGYLVTVWNENTIELHRARPRGVSLEATPSALVSGGPEFRPVAFGASSDGTLYFTDWVKVDYPNHGEGKIWRLAPRPDVPRRPHRSRFAPPEKNEGSARLARHYELGDLASIERGLDETDPFLRHAAREAARGLDTQSLGTLLEHSRPGVRRGALLAHPTVLLEKHPERLRRALGDPDPGVRHAALLRAGVELHVDLVDDLARAIRGPGTDGVLFAAYLAAVECLTGEFPGAFRRRASDSTKRLPARRLPEGLVESLVTRQDLPAPVRALAVERLEATSPLVLELAGKIASLPSELRRPLVWKLSDRADDEGRSHLIRLALSKDREPTLRAEALTALGHHEGIELEPLREACRDESPVVGVEALRLWRGREISVELRRELEELRERAASGDAGRSRIEEIDFLLEREPTPARPASPDAWKQAVKEGGDPDSGRRVFFSRLASCSSCHSLDGRGALLGPDLSRVAQSVERDQIVHSILRPSDSCPPQYLAWQVITRQGTIHRGLQLDHKARGAIEMITTEGAVRRFEGKDILTYEVTRESLMPAGLEEALTVSAFRDLVAFLASRK